jgi:hypothetical protein
MLDNRIHQVKAAGVIATAVLRKNCSVLILSDQYDWDKTDHLS